MSFNYVLRGEMKKYILLFFITNFAYAQDKDLSCQFVTSIAGQTAMSSFIQSYMYSFKFDSRTAVYCISAGFYEQGSLVDIRIKNALKTYPKYKKQADLRKAALIKERERVRLQMQEQKQQQNEQQEINKQLQAEQEKDEQNYLIQNGWRVE